MEQLRPMRSLARVLLHRVRRRGRPNLLTLGGCNALNAVRALERRGLANVVPDGSVPMYSPAEILQYVQFCVRERPVSGVVRSYCAFDVANWMCRGRHFLDADVVFLEIDSSTRVDYAGLAISVVAIQQRVVNPIAAEFGGERGQIARTWLRQGVIRGNETIRDAASRELLSLMKTRKYGERDRDVVRHARGACHTVEEMTREITEIGARLSKPMCLMVHPHMYMPDGRPVFWPAGLRDQVTHISERLGLPVIHLDEFVRAMGAERAVKAGWVHYTAECLEEIGDAMLTAARALTPAAGSARLEALAEPAAR